MVTPRPSPMHRRDSSNLNRISETDETVIDSCFVTENSRVSVNSTFSGFNKFYQILNSITILNPY